MIDKAYSVFLCVLLISVLFFPLTTAGRVLLDTPQNEDGSGKHGNGGNKIDVHGSPSKPAGSAAGQSSPAQATPSRKGNGNKIGVTATGSHSKTASSRTGSIVPNTKSSSSANNLPSSSALSCRETNRACKNVYKKP